jgi:sugar phosphate isomerase/epimerase
MIDRVPQRRNRPLGTMVVHGYRDLPIEVDLELARRLGATLVEILPEWRQLRPAEDARDRVADQGLAVHSVHGCWGGQSIEAPRVDLGSPDPATRAASVADIRRCLDWTATAGGRVLVVHPGGLSLAEEAPARRDALLESLDSLADHAAGSGLVVCVENMPSGVFPGSFMADLRRIVDELDRPEVALALDTGHAHIASTLDQETQDAGARLLTTHVHDNNGRQDSHEIPGSGTIDWPSWRQALDRIAYQGPIILECIRRLRTAPERIDAAFLQRLSELTGNEPER